MWQTNKLTLWFLESLILHLTYITWDLIWRKLKKLVHKAKKIGMSWSNEQRSKVIIYFLTLCYCLFQIRWAFESLCHLYIFINYLFGPEVPDPLEELLPILLLNFLTALDRVILFLTCFDIKDAPVVLVPAVLLPSSSIVVTICTPI